MAVNHGLEMDALESSEPSSGTVEGASADPTGPQLNPPASTPRDPEQGTGARYRSSTGPEVTNTPMPLWKLVLIVSSLVFCFAGCLNYIVSIGIEVSCMWPNLSEQSTANSTTADKTAPIVNDTCPPEESQEDIPYDLIDLVLYLQLIIIVILWKFKYAKYIQGYEQSIDTREIDEVHEEKEFRVRRTYYFISLNLLFFFLFHCVECVNCSFLNPNVFFGTAIKNFEKKYCPWINFLFQLPAVPAYILYCWYATKMACVLRRRADKIEKKSEELFGTDNKTTEEDNADDQACTCSCICIKGTTSSRRNTPARNTPACSQTLLPKISPAPGHILKELRGLFYDEWGEKVWKSISVVMNIMMYFSVILVLLYTHVYISNVKLTIGRWFSHFMRLLSIASLSIIPYLYVAFACVRVTEAIGKTWGKIIKAERDDNEGESSDITRNDHSSETKVYSVRAKTDDNPESEDIDPRPVNEVNTDSIALRESDSIAIRLDKLDKDNQLRERRAQWDRLHQDISKVQGTALYNGILSSAYTTRNGVHWTLLAMIGAVAWEVLDHLNAFEDSSTSDTNKNRFIVALYGILALVATLLVVIIVLFWQLCCGAVRFKKLCTPGCCTDLSQNMINALQLATFTGIIVLFWAIIYIGFFFGVNQNTLCTMELNPLVS